MRLKNIYGEYPTGPYCARFVGTYNQGDIDGLRFYAARQADPPSSTTDCLQIGSGVSSLWFQRVQLDKGRINLTIGDDLGTAPCQYLRFYGLATEAAALENVRLNTAAYCSFNDIYGNLSAGYGLHSMPGMETYGEPCVFNGGQFADNQFENILLEGDPGIYFSGGFTSSGAGTDITGSGSSVFTYPQMRVSAPISRFKLKDTRLGGGQAGRVDETSQILAAVQIDNLAIMQVGNVQATIGGTITAGNTVTLTFTSSSGTQQATYPVLSGDRLVDIAKGLVTACQAISSLLPNFGFSYSGAVVTINMPMTGIRWTVSGTVSSGATETISVAGNLVTGDIIKLTFTSPSSVAYTAAYAVHTTDTLATVTAGLCSALLIAGLPSPPWTPTPFVVQSTGLSTGPGIIATTLPPAADAWTFSYTVTNSGTEIVTLTANNPYFVIENNDLRGNVTAIIDNSPPSANKIRRANVGDDALTYNINTVAGGALSLTSRTDAVVQNSTATLTSNLTVTLNATGAAVGDKFKWINNTPIPSSFTVTVGGQPLTHRQFVDFEFDGTQWHQVAGGTLL